jgi:hypothetical protein
MGGNAKFCPSCGTPARGSAPAAKPGVEKAGKIRKCPSCGAPVESFQARCPSCGHEFSNVGVAGSVKEFFEKIMELDSRPRPPQEKVQKKSLLRGAVSVGIFFVVLSVLGVFLEWFSDMDTELYPIFEGVCVVLFAILTFWRRTVFTEADNQKKTLIENFPIPNSKEDIIEFLILASSKIIPAHGFSATARMQKEWNKIWAVKCRQVYIKTDIAFAGDEKSQEIVKNIREKNEGYLSRAKKQATVAVLAAVGIGAAVVIAAVGTYTAKREGVGIVVPELVTIAPEDVNLRGAFAEYLKVTGGGVTLTWNEASRHTKMTIEIDALEDLNLLLKRGFEKAVREKKKWDPRYCTYKSLLTKVSINGKSFYDHENFLATILRLKPGNPRVITVSDSEVEGDTMAEIKTAAAQFMAMKAVGLSLEVEFSEVNYDPPNKKKEDYNYTSGLAFDL